MDPTWHATNADYREHALPPDGPSSRSPSLAAKHTSERPAPGELEKAISFFESMYDDMQTWSPRYPPVVNPADFTDPFRDAVPKSRTATLLDAPVGPWNKASINSSVGRTNAGKTERFHQQWHKEPSTTINARSEQPTSRDTVHCHNSDFPVSSTPHTIQLSNREVSPQPHPDVLLAELTETAALFKLSSSLIDLSLSIRRKQSAAKQKLEDGAWLETQEQDPWSILELSSLLTLLAHEQGSMDSTWLETQKKDIWKTILRINHFVLSTKILELVGDAWLEARKQDVRRIIGRIKKRTLPKWDTAMVHKASVVTKFTNPATAKSSAASSKYTTAATDFMKVRLDHVIPGLLDSQHIVDAIGDTGARYNFLNEDYAKRCKFKIDSTLGRPITIASGQKIMTSGIAEVSFCFRGEQTPHPLKFHVLPGCVKNVILGKSFLKATKTFSDGLNFAKRVVKRFVRTLSTHQVLYLGGSPPMFAGLLNGETKTALADSASKVLLMDEDYARALGLSIVSTKETRIKLRFADGSTAFTLGKTYNVSWQFGTGKRYPLDFYILKNAPADVILSEDFLLRESKAFIKYADCLIEEDEDGDFGYYDDSDDDNYFFAIYRDDNYHPQAYTEGADEYFEDDHEDARRIEEDLHIASLYGAEKDAAIARAKVRREQWAVKQAANRLAQGGQNNTTNSASSSAAPQPQTNNAAGVPSASKRQRWLYKLVKKRKSGKAGQNP